MIEARIVQVRIEQSAIDASIAGAVHDHPCVASGSPGPKLLLNGRHVIVCHSDLVTATAVSVLLSMRAERRPVRSGSGQGGGLRGSIRIRRQARVLLRL